MNSENTRNLITKYNSGTASAQEIALLENWYAEKSESSTLSDDDIDFYLLESLLYTKTIAYARLNQPVIVNRSRQLWPRIVAAASILLILAGGTYFLVHHKNNSFNDAQQLAHDIAPGSNKATLTLANGKQIVLTGAQNGKLALQNNTTVNKTADGQVIYRSSTNKTADNNEIIYNTMSTPKGGQYHLTLADGTNVWLNAASSIRYPVAFSGNERKVEITGEVYFEVKHNALKPFRVVSDKQTIEVLGTHFNINAYPNESAVKTTLLEGSVRVNTNGSKATLKVGQQSTLIGNKINIADVDVNEVIAWKDGYFEFSGTDIQTIMRQLSRWYDVDVVFEGVITPETFTGRISRNKNISQVLKIVKASKSVNIEIQGRRIMVKE